MNLLANMDAFVRTIETGSLSAAGRDLGMSQSAISQKITTLEAHLQTRLVNRTTRKLSPTEAGIQYYQNAKSILDAVHEANETASGVANRLTGSLRIHAPIGFGQMHLADAAIDFQKQHPDIKIDLVLSDEYVNLTENAVDLAIRFGTLRSDGLIARRLGTLRRIIVASPEYLEKFGVPNTPQSLSQHTQVQFNGTQDKDTMPLLGPSGFSDVPVKTNFFANNAFVLIKAMEEGLGLGGVQLPLVQQKLQTGKLVHIMKKYEYAPMDVHAIYPSSRFIPMKVRTFVQYLTKTARDVWWL